MKKFFINKVRVTTHTMAEAISAIAEHPAAYHTSFENSDDEFRITVFKLKKPIYKAYMAKAEAETAPKAEAKLKIPSLGGGVWEMKLTRIVKPAEKAKGFTIYLDHKVTTTALFCLQEMLKEGPVKIAVEYTVNGIEYAKILYENLYIPFPEQYIGRVNRPKELGPETPTAELEKAYVELQKLEQSKFEQLKNEFYNEYAKLERDIIEWANFRNTDIYPINAQLPGEMEAEQASVGRFPEDLTEKQKELVRYLQEEGPAYGIQVPYLYVTNETYKKTSYLPMKKGNKPIVKYVNARCVFTHRTQLRTNSTYKGVKQERKTRLLLESFGVDQYLLQQRVCILNYLKRNGGYELPYFHKCEVCGRMHPEKDLVRYDKKWICIECLMATGENPKKLQNVDFFESLNVGRAEDELYYMLAEAKAHPDFKLLCEYYGVTEEGLEAHLRNTMGLEEMQDDEEEKLVDHFEEDEDENDYSEDSDDEEDEEDEE